MLWRALRDRQLAGAKFRRQHEIAGFVVDFVCLEEGLIVEIDGGQHAWRAHKDAFRTERLEEAGYRIIRFWNNDVLGNLEGVLDTIRTALESPPHPDPLPHSMGARDIDAAPPRPAQRGEGRGEGNPRPRVLVTRPEEDAAGLAAALEARGIAAVLAPMLEIVYRAGSEPDLDGVQALVVTSANGVRAFARVSARRDLPVLAVGDASAREARAAGFLEVASAAGDVADLARLVKRTCSPREGELLHVAGSAVAGDLTGLLEHDGFACRRVVLYDARPRDTLPEVGREALQGGTVEAAAFFSPRTASAFVAAARKAQIAEACGRLHALCLSEAVAHRLAGSPWRGVHVAAAPEQEALVELAVRVLLPGG
jgi:uroporphyrinogen-III synthase